MQGMLLIVVGSGISWFTGYLFPLLGVLSVTGISLGAICITLGLISVRL